MLGVLKQTLCVPGPREPTETEPELCLSVSCGVQVSYRDKGSGASRLGYGISLLGGDHHKAIRTYTGLGKQTLGGHKQKLGYARTPEKGVVTPQETDPDLLVSVQESLVEVWISGCLLQGWGH